MHNITCIRAIIFVIWMLVPISLFPSRENVVGKELTIQGQWYVTCPGDLIFPLRPWHIWASLKKADSLFTGTGYIPFSSFKFDCINLKVDTNSLFYMGRWSPFSHLKIHLTEDGNTALGAHIYDFKWDSLQVESPMLWTRLESDTTKEDINSYEAWEKIKSGETLYGKRIIGDLKADYDTIPSRVVMINCEFKGDISFTGSRFESGVDFTGSVFNGTAMFVWTTFNMFANFSACGFENDAYFSYSAFTADTNFQGRALFLFNGAEFEDDADLRQAIFGGYTSFASALFSKDGNFLRCQYDTLDLRDCNIEQSIVLTNSEGNLLLLGGVKSENAILNHATVRDALLIESDFVRDLSPIASGELTRVSNNLDLREAEIRTLRLMNIEVGGKVEIASRRLDSIILNGLSASSISIDNCNISGGFNSDISSMSSLETRFNILFPEGSSSIGKQYISTKSFLALARRFHEMEQYGDLNKALLAAKYAQLNDILENKDFVALSGWIFEYMLGFGRSIILILTWGTIVWITFGFIYFKIGFSPTGKFEISSQSRPREITFHIKKPPLARSAPSHRINTKKGIIYGIKCALELSGAALLKVNTGRLYYPRRLWHSILVWLEWFIGYIYYYSFLLAIATKFPVVRDLLSIR